MALMRVMIAVNDVNEVQILVPHWEVPVLQTVWLNRLLHIETVPAEEAALTDRPPAGREYARLRSKYGVSDTGERFVAQAYGNAPLGVTALQKAIQDDTMAAALAAAQAAPEIEGVDGPASTQEAAKIEGVDGPASTQEAAEIEGVDGPASTQEAAEIEGVDGPASTQEAAKPAPAPAAKKKTTRGKEGSLL